MKLSAVPESCPELLLSSTIYSHGEGPDSRQWELCQQPQHLPPSAVAAGRVSCPEKQLRGSDVVTAGGGIPISSSSGHTGTRARPFGTWSQLVCGALRSCAGSLPLPAVPPGSQGLPGCSLFLQAFGFCCSLPRCARDWNGTASSHHSKPELGSPKS